MGRVVVGRSSDEILQLASDFFMKKDDVHLTMRRVTERLREENIPHALIGGMAIGLHGFLRVTRDVDLLTTNEGLDRIHERLVGRGFVPSFPGARKRLRDTVTGVSVDFITTGEYPGDGKPKSVMYPDPSDSVELDGYRVLSLPRLIESKIVSGTTVDYRQLQDLGDVQSIIRDCTCRGHSPSNSTLRFVASSTVCGCSRRSTIRSSTPDPFSAAHASPRAGLRVGPLRAAGSLRLSRGNAG